MLDKLFTPFDLSTLHVRNRFVMAPMTRRQSPGGVPNAENAEHYRRRAAGGVGLIITEGTYVRGPAAGPSTAVPRIYGAESAAGWRRVVDAVHAEGAAIIPQLWHTGVARGTDADFEPDVASVSPSGIDLQGRPLGRAAGPEDLDALVAAFAESAALAREVGFDGVELHGAHGYLLDQFLWAGTNRRTDAFGGSIARRSAFPATVVSAVRSAVGPDFPIVFRWSQWKSGLYDARLAADPTELEQVLSPLAAAGVDVFHVSTRRHWEPAFAGDPTGLAGWTRRVTGLPVITVGSVGVDRVFHSEDEPIDRSPEERLGDLSHQLDRGEVDLVALGRALLADPAWVEKHRAGRSAEVIPYTPAAAA